MGGWGTVQIFLVNKNFDSLRAESRRDGSGRKRVV